MDSWVASDQLRALSSAEAELYGIVDDSTREIFTKHTYEEMGTISIDVETDSTAAIGMCSRTGVGRTRHIPVRWLWIVLFRKVKGTENAADMGTKYLDGPTHQRLLEKLPLKPTQCRRLLGLMGKPRSGLPAWGGAARCSMSGVFWCGAVGTVVLVRPAGQETRGSFQFYCCVVVRGFALSGVCVSLFYSVFVVSRWVDDGIESPCFVLFPHWSQQSGSGQCSAILARVSPLFVCC